MLFRSLAGYTGVRVTVSDSIPPAANEVNTASVRPVDYQTIGGDQSTQLVLCYLADATSPLPGDLDGNGIVDIFDLQHLVNVLLGLEANARADVNGDTRIDILDLQRLVNLLLGA